MTRIGSVDERFAAFGNASRRRVLAHLRSASADSEGVRFETLVSGLADGESTDSEAYARARSDLVHVHLPKLEAAELIDRDGETVRLAVAPSVVRDGMRLAERFETA